MSHLARRANTGSGGTRVLLVRQPIRSVRSSHEASPLPVQLAIGVIVTVGVVATIWLFGFLGYYLGFAPRMGLPGLELSAGGGLVVAASAIISMPLTIMRAGMSDPLLLMVGFAAIAIPAAALGAVRPAAPGGPRPHVLTVTFSYAGAIFAGLYSMMVLWWIVSPLRGDLIQSIPATPVDLANWLGQWRLAAGLDVLALVAMSLWIVLVMRLVIPRWLRGLAGGVCFTVLAIVFTAASSSNVTVSQSVKQRTVVAMLDGAISEQVLLLGEAHGRLATLRAGPAHVTIELVEQPERLRVVNNRSLVEFIGDHHLAE